MSIGKIKQREIPLLRSQKRDVRTQFATLCYRKGKDGGIKVLLVTSRDTKRWITPKGWPMPGATPAASAEREAWEEAGVKGRIGSVCLGIFSYTKGMERSDDLPCVVALFPMKVESVASDYPERKERKRKWFTLEKAAAKVDEPELSQIILNFRPELFFG